MESLTSPVSMFLASQIDSMNSPLNERIKINDTSSEVLSKAINKSSN